MFNITMTGKKLHYLSVEPTVSLRNWSKTKKGDLFVFVLTLTVHFRFSEKDGGDPQAFEYEFECALENVSHETKVQKITDYLISKAREYFQKTHIGDQITPDLEDKKPSIKEWVQYYLNSIITEPVQLWNNSYTFHRVDSLLTDGFRDGSLCILLELDIAYNLKDQTFKEVVIKHEFLFFISAMRGWLFDLNEHVIIAWNDLLEQVEEFFLGLSMPQTLERINEHLQNNKDYILKSIEFYLKYNLYQEQPENEEAEE